jgi:hypothetical protein
MRYVFVTCLYEVEDEVDSKSPKWKALEMKEMSIQAEKAG